MGKSAGSCTSTSARGGGGGGRHATLRPDDYAISSREHGTGLAKVSDPTRMAGCSAGRTGCQGKAGSMHLFYKSVNFLAATASSALTSAAAGARFAINIPGGDQVVLRFFFGTARSECEFHGRSRRAL